MIVTIINDCRDANVASRQITRASSLFKYPATLVGVDNELEAAGNLIDAMDASEGRQGVVLVNVAPRHGKAKKWENGSPFCYFFYGETLIATTVDGLTLSLAKKFSLTKSVHVFDAPKTLDALIEDGLLRDELKDHILNTQFRSYDFLPRAAAYVMKHHSAPGESHSISEVPGAPRAVWWIDNFGNCKTTLLPKEVDYKSIDALDTLWGTFKCYKRLKDVPDGEPGIVVGSSGIEKDRFLEIVVQGGSAADSFGIKSGDVVELTESAPVSA